MKLAYVIDGLSHGGAERSLLDMTPYWVESGIKLHVIVLGGSDVLREPMEKAGARVQVLAPAPRRDQFTVLRGLLTETRPGLVHTTLAESDLIGRVAARAVRVPVTSSLVNHSYGREHLREGPTAKLRAFQALDAVTARLTTRLHAVSESVASVMSLRLRYPRQRIAVIPRGRDLERFGQWSPIGQVQRRSELGLPADTPLLVTVASHEYRKGLDVLLAALPSLPDATLCILGRPGRESERLRQDARDLGVSARVVWMSARNDVETVLQASDAFVLPSRREGFPGALIEAMATGLPIAASDIPPVREALGSLSSGVHLAAVEDPQSLARACRRALATSPPVIETRTHAANLYDLPGVANRMALFFRGTL